MKKEPKNHHKVAVVFTDEFFKFNLIEPDKRDVNIDVVVVDNDDKSE